METKKRRPYERPVSTCTVVRLESPICSGSDFQAQAPHGGSESIQSHQVNTTFEGVNDFSDNNNGGWDLGA